MPYPWRSILDHRIHSFVALVLSRTLSLFTVTLQPIILRHGVTMTASTIRRMVPMGGCSLSFFSEPYLTTSRLVQHTPTSLSLTLRIWRKTSPKTPILQTSIPGLDPVEKNQLSWLTHTLTLKGFLVNLTSCRHTTIVYSRLPKPSWWYVIFVFIHNAVLTNIVSQDMTLSDESTQEAARTMLTQGYRKLESLLTSTHSGGTWATYFKEETISLIQAKSVRHVGHHSSYVDIVGDVINLLPIHWISEEIVSTVQHTRLNWPIYLSRLGFLSKQKRTKAVLGMSKTSIRNLQMLAGLLINFFLRLDSWSLLAMCFWTSNPLMTGIYEKALSRFSKKSAITLELTWIKRKTM